MSSRGRLGGNEMKKGDSLLASCTNVARQVAALKARMSSALKTYQLSRPSECGDALHDVRRMTSAAPSNAGDNFLNERMRYLVGLIRSLIIF